MKILAILPCYNEADSIGNVLKEFQALNFIDTLVIDDGSTDATAETAAKFTIVIRHEINRGVTASIITGLQYAIDHDYDYAIQIDGDGQHVPSEIALFAPHMQHGECNIIIGSRYHGAMGSNIYHPRRLAGIITSISVYMLFGRFICDPLSGMRMMDRHAMRYFRDNLPTTHPDAMIVPMALHNGMAVSEVPVRMRPRLHGTSYVAGINGARFMLRLIKKMLGLRGGAKHFSP